MARKKSDTPDDGFPIKLTKPQRETLVHGTRLKRSIKQTLARAGEGTQIVRVTRKDLDHLNDEIGAAAQYAAGADKQRLLAVLKKTTAVLDKSADVDVTPKSRVKARRSTQTPSQVFQFKITLLDIKPAIWRRIQVPDGTLADLHEYIQAAFGWWNYHLHQFEIEGEEYGPLDPEDLDFGLEVEDESRVRLSDLLSQSRRKARWLYDYDFGDGWRHEVLFECYPPVDPQATYPQCVAGARACPPEDCGGPWGYEEYLAAMADPRHEQHEELLAWRGPFDPEAFDATQATDALRKLT